MNEQPLIESCTRCNDFKFILHNCCSGRECGCMGMPTAVSYCPECNPKGEIEPPESIAEFVNHCELVPLT